MFPSANGKESMQLLFNEIFNETVESAFLVVKCVIYCTKFYYHHMVRSEFQDYIQSYTKAVEWITFS